MHKYFSCRHAHLQIICTRVSRSTFKDLLQLQFEYRYWLLAIYISIVLGRLKPPILQRTRRPRQSHVGSTSSIIDDGHTRPIAYATGRVCLYLSPKITLK